MDIMCVLLRLSCTTVKICMQTKNNLYHYKRSPIYMLYVHRIMMNIRKLQIKEIIYDIQDLFYFINILLSL